MQKLDSSQIELIRSSGIILKKTLDKVVNALKPGVVTETLNKIAEEEIRKYGGRPSFKNYSLPGQNPYPKSICVSIDDEVVHGIPNKDVVIREGAVVGVDIGVEYKGLFSDAARTVIAGNARNTLEQKLIETTREALKVGISAAKAGNTTGDIGYYIERHVQKAGFEVVKQLVGHGIGTKPHQDPNVPNFGYRKRGEMLVENSAIAIEPMVVMGNSAVKVASDDWTVKTIDGSISAHFESTILIKKGKAEVII